MDEKEFRELVIENGKRIVKDFTSNVSGGIHRQVKAYDINGETENQAIY